MNTLTNQLTLLTFDNVHLVVPLSEVATIERTRQMQSYDAAGRRLGSLSHVGRRYPVYGFSPELDLLTQLPAQRVFCVCLSAGEDQIKLALACDATLPIRLEQSEPLKALPECMQRVDTPLQGFLKHGERLVLFSTTAALASYINRMENRDECAC